MTSRSWIRRLFARPASRPHVGPRRRLGLEALEDRMAPAGFCYEVTGTGDATASISGGSGTQANPYLIPTLRAALTDANADNSNDTIEFAPSLTSGGPATITLASALPALAANVSISGPGANLLAVSGHNSVGI